MEQEIKDRLKKLGHQIQERKLADVPEQDRDATRQAVLTDPKDQTNEQKRLLFLYPMVRPVNRILGQLVEFDNAAYRKVEEERKRIAALRAEKPPRQLVMATYERPDVVPVSRVFHRGNPTSPGDQVHPGTLTVLQQGRAVDIPVDNASLPSSGRRLAWARQLTDGAHPLTARVFVNRVWMHHFGRGLVATPGDFGISGDAPSHPKLLDWLADDFVRHGWDQKRLHRMILLSTTWQQITRRTPERDAVDPENELLGRMNLRRLQAEELRDAVLTVTGQLDDRLGGPAVPITENSEGKVVIGRRLKRDGIKAGVDRSGAAGERRSVYIEVQRKLPLNMLATFDQPEMTPNCEQRRQSTAATQALWFLNDSEILDRSTQLAELMMKQHPDAASRIEHLYLRLFADWPTEDEMRSCAEFLAVEARHFETQTTDENSEIPDADLRALAILCQSLLASNRFLYVD